MANFDGESQSNNRSYDWEQFNCEAYVEDNYSSISAADRAIVEILVDCHKQVPRGGSMIEIGAGPNLYPVMAASAFRDHVCVTDIASCNLHYLEAQITSETLQEPWTKWAKLLRTLDNAYGESISNLATLRNKCTFERLSIFELPTNRFDFVSMHFVAESITTDYDEFVAGCTNALRCLKPTGAFGASFMLSSHGYSTADIEFPAIMLNAQQICDVLAKECSHLVPVVLEGPRYTIRKGHSGILLVHGNR